MQYKNNTDELQYKTTEIGCNIKQQRMNTILNNKEWI